MPKNLLTAPAVSAQSKTGQTDSPHVARCNSQNKKSLSRRDKYAEYSAAHPPIHQNYPAHTKDSPPTLPPMHRVPRSRLNRQSRNTPTHAHDSHRITHTHGRLL